VVGLYCTIDLDITNSNTSLYLPGSCLLQTPIYSLRMMHCNMAHAKNSMFHIIINQQPFWPHDSTTTDPLIHHGCHFGCAIFTFCNVKSLIINGLDHMCTNSDPRSLTAKLVTPYVLFIYSFMVTLENNEKKKISMCFWSCAFVSKSNFWTHCLKKLSW